MKFKQIYVFDNFSNLGLPSIWYQAEGWCLARGLGCNEVSLFPTWKELLVGMSDEEYEAIYDHLLAEGHGDPIEVLQERADRIVALLGAQAQGGPKELN